MFYVPQTLFTVCPKRFCSSDTTPKLFFAIEDYPANTTCPQLRIKVVDPKEKEIAIVTHNGFLFHVQLAMIVTL
ncbi:unnamed protein product [Camellia sinensis]